MTTVEIIRLDATFTGWNEFLALILDAFAYMDDIIDPPSSAKRLTPEKLKDKAEGEIVFLAIENGALAGCIFCNPEADDVLYIGKLAVSPQHQGKGIGKRLMAAAEALAGDMACRSLRLETRIELVSNHLRFGGYGFEKTAEKSHPGYRRITFIEMRKAL